MNVHVKFFASAADAAGQRERRIGLPEGADVRALLDVLCEEFPRLARLRRQIRVAVNHEYVRESGPLKEGDEVALIPPVSGGIR
ncbi:MAG: molybdopterin converting factor subunit 1 [Planctomycetes bacterium]|nr:molybdopterin converting factor subunit 1 [Planctomycetota bacterium]